MLEKYQACEKSYRSPGIPIDPNKFLEKDE
jgi:hypothetical protein